MLVVTRRIKEGIVIDGNIAVTVLEVRGSNVRIGIRAPRTVEVLRNELTTAGKTRRHRRRP